MTPAGVRGPPRFSPSGKEPGSGLRLGLIIRPAESHGGLQMSWTLISAKTEASCLAPVEHLER